MEWSFSNATADQSIGRVFSLQLSMFQVFIERPKGGTPIGAPPKKNSLEKSYIPRLFHYYPTIIPRLFHYYPTILPRLFHYYPTVFQQYSHHMPLDSKQRGVSQVGGSQKSAPGVSRKWNTANGCLGWKRISHVRESSRCIHNNIYP